eukprot:219883_1
MRVPYASRYLLFLLFPFTLIVILFLVMMHNYLMQLNLYLIYMLYIFVFTFIVIVGSYCDCEILLLNQFISFPNVILFISFGFSNVIFNGNVLPNLLLNILYIF